MVWVDATGAVVGPEPVFIDDAGVQWDLNTATAEVAPRPLSGNNLYTAADCAGDAYAEGTVLPRLGHVLSLDDGGISYVVRDDTTPSPRISAQSVFINGACLANQQPPYLATPRSAFREVGLAQSPYTGPLHREWR